jgi:RNA polymerase sigma factor (TIGR02999 family)
MLGGVADVKQILSAIEAGDPRAAEELLPLVYDELRKLAAAHLADEKPGQTLQPTALVHAAYLRLIDTEKAQHWKSRGHFFAAAAEAMRRILVEQARKRKRRKRGGDRRRVALADIAASAPDLPAEDVLAIDEALAHLTQEDAAKAELVKLRFYAGLSVTEAAECLGISRATADRYWAYARAWLYDRLHRDG